MGTGRKKKEPVAGTKKELVIITRPVITLDQVKNDTRKRNLLAFFDLVTAKSGGVFEKTLNYLLYWFKTEKGIDLGYNFVMLGNVPYSRDLHEDVVALLYLGLIEATPQKKLRITNDGREFLQKVGYDAALAEKMKEALEEYWPKAVAIETQIELEQREMAREMARRRRRRRVF